VIWILLAAATLVVLGAQGDDSPSPGRGPGSNPQRDKLIAGATNTAIPGVKAKVGVVLTKQVSQALLKLRQALPPSVDIVVTDGWRSPEGQAARLWSRYKKGGTISGKAYPPGWGVLYALYRADWIIDELKSVGADRDAWADVLKDLAADHHYLSDHQLSRAFDLRTRGMPSAHRILIIKTVTRLGGEPLDEGDHLHIENLD